MGKKLKIMDVQLNMETVHDILPVIDGYLKSNHLNTISAISMRMLMMAQKDKNIKDIINSYDLALPGEIEILQHGNIRENILYREIKENYFFHQFMNLVDREQRTVYLLGETEYQMRELENYILKEHTSVNIVGGGQLSDGKEVAALINEINIMAPDVILSVIPSPNQEWFIRDRRNMIDAKIWYGLNGEYRLNTTSRMLHARAQTFIRKLSFKNIMASYHKGNSDK